MFYDHVCQRRDRLSKARPISFMIERHPTWSLESFGRADVNLSIDNIMICNARKNLGPVNLAWPICNNQVKYIAVKYITQLRTATYAHARVRTCRCVLVRVYTCVHVRCVSRPLDNWLPVLVRSTLQLNISSQNLSYQDLNACTESASTRLYT